MNRIGCFFLIFSFLVFKNNGFSQDNSLDKIEVFDFNYLSSFNSEDTILGIPFFSNHDFHFFSENKITDFLNNDNNYFSIDFSDYIDRGKSLSFKLFSENDILFFGFPKENTFYSFGLKYSTYFDLNLSNELLNLFWNGNSQYLNKITEFKNNTASLVQFASIFFQYSNIVSEKFSFNTRISLLHGINFFELNKGDFSLNTADTLVTPFSTNIETDMMYKSSQSNIFGLANPGLSFNFALNYNVNKWNFLFDFQNIGFLIWHKNSTQHQSRGDYIFDGVHYNMQQIISEEFENTVDTLENIFALQKQSEDAFIYRLPIRINFKPSFSYNISTDFFIDYYAIENNISGFSQHCFFGLSKKIKKWILYSSYNLNNYNHYNLQFGFAKKFKRFLIHCNTNNILSFFDFNNGNYTHFEMGMFYIF